LATGSSDKSVNIWDLRRFEQAVVPIRRAHNAAVKALAWSPHRSDLLATGGGSACRALRLWNATTGRRVASRKTRSQITGVCWSPATSELATSLGWPDYGLATWSYHDGAIAPLERSSTRHYERLLCLAGSSDGRVATVCAGEVICIWKLFGAAPRTRVVEPSVARRRDVRRWDRVFAGGVGGVVR